MPSLYSEKFTFQLVILALFCIGVKGENLQKSKSPKPAYRAGSGEFAITDSDKLCIDDV